MYKQLAIDTKIAIRSAIQFDRWSDSVILRSQSDIVALIGARSTRSTIYETPRYMVYTTCNASWRARTHARIARTHCTWRGFIRRRSLAMFGGGRSSRASSSISSTARKDIRAPAGFSHFSARTSPIYAFAPFAEPAIIYRRIITARAFRVPHGSLDTIENGRFCTRFGKLNVLSRRTCMSRSTRCNSWATVIQYSYRFLVFTNCDGGRYKSVVQVNGNRTNLVVQINTNQNQTLIYFFVLTVELPKTCANPLSKRIFFSPSLLFPPLSMVPTETALAVKVFTHAWVKKWGKRGSTVELQ